MTFKHTNQAKYSVAATDVATFSAPLTFTSGLPLGL